MKGPLTNCCEDHDGLMSVSIVNSFTMGSGSGRRSCSTERSLEVQPAVTKPWESVR